MFGKRKAERGPESSSTSDGDLNATQAADTANGNADVDAPWGFGKPVGNHRAQHGSGHEATPFVKTTQQFEDSHHTKGGVDASRRGDSGAARTDQGNTAASNGTPTVPDIPWGKGLGDIAPKTDAEATSQSAFDLNTPSGASATVSGWSVLHPEGRTGGVSMDGSPDAAHAVSSAGASAVPNNADSDGAPAVSGPAATSADATTTATDTNTIDTAPSQASNAPFHTSNTAAQSSSKAVVTSTSTSTAAATATAVGGFVPDPFDDVVDVTDVQERYRKLRRSMWAMRIVSILLLVLAACVIGYPLVLQYQSEQQLAEVSDTSAETVAGWPYPEAEDALAAAREYNENLFESGQPILGEASDPFSSESGGSHASGEDSASANDEEYQSLLDTGGGVMGTISVPEVSIELPIYHGTSETALASGAGHLYGTSLPVGGENTHSVITGHRGLVEAMMFTRLDEVEVGDVFYIEVMGETLAYTVDRITVIEPTDTSQLTIVEGEDRVTLMTCTPYGVNTHRLLISGLRSAMPDDAPYLDDAPGDARTAGLITTGLILAAGWLLTAWSRRGPWQAMRHGALWPRHW